MDVKEAINKRAKSMSIKYDVSKVTCKKIMLETCDLIEELTEDSKRKGDNQ